MNTHSIVTPKEWEAARLQLLVKEKELTRARDAMAAERRRMPWLAVQKEYEFDGPAGKASLPELFEGRRQLIVYRAFFEPGVYGWPDHACPGCSLVADQVAHVAHLNARDTTLAFVSRGSQPDIERVKARMGWTMPWYTITDDSTLTSAWTSGTVRTPSSAMDRACSAPTSSTTAETNQWGAPGATWTSPRSDGRRSGRTRLMATPRPRRTRGGGGTTRTTQRRARGSVALRLQPRSRNGVRAPDPMLTLYRSTSVSYVDCASRDGRPVSPERSARYAA